MRYGLIAWTRVSANSEKGVTFEWAVRVGQRLQLRFGKSGAARELGLVPIVVEASKIREGFSNTDPHQSGLAGAVTAFFHIARIFQKIPRLIRRRQKFIFQMQVFENVWNLIKHIQDIIWELKMTKKINLREIKRDGVFPIIWVFSTILPPTQRKIRNWPHGWAQILQGPTLDFPKIYSSTYQIAATQEVSSTAHQKMRVLSLNMTRTTLMCRQQLRWPFWILILQALYLSFPSILILQAPPNLHPFVLEGLVHTKTFFTLLLGVAYSVSKSESSSSSEVRNYDHHRQEINKQTRETNTPCVPFDVFLFYYWERYEQVDHVRHRGLKECVAIRFSPRPYFAGLFRALQAPLRRRK